MIRVAVCDRVASERIRLRNAIERYARGANINNIEVTLFANAAALERAVMSMRPGCFDLCSCRIDAAQDGAAMMDVLRNLHADSPDMRLVLVSAEKSDAIHAYDFDAGFLLVAGAYDDFVRVMSGPLSDIVGKNSDVAVVKSRGSVENVLLADIQFVESSKRGSIIHLPLGKTVVSRSPLQALFESLAESERQGAGKAGGADGSGSGSGSGAGSVGPRGENGEESGDDAGGAGPGRASGNRRKRFVKAGSSFIVNLDNVRSAGEGSLIFADGETIIVPIRKRKEVLDALRSYQMR